VAVKDRIVGPPVPVLVLVLVDGVGRAVEVLVGVAAGPSSTVWSLASSAEGSVPLAPRPALAGLR